MASAETENLAAIMLAVTWYWTRREKPGFVTFIVFYLIMFVGSHMKGLTAFVVPVLVVFPDLLRERRWRWFFWPSHLLALGIGIIIYLAPFAYAALTQPESYNQSGLYLVFHENILRYFQAFDHKGPIYQYLGSVPLLTLPWAPILISAMIASIISWKKLDSHTRWLLQTIFLIFIFFTLSGSRRDYYILPIIPFCMLLMAVFLTETRREVIGKYKEGGLRNQKYALIAVAFLEMTLGPIAIWFLVSKMDWEVPSLLGWSFLVVGLVALLTVVVAYKLDGRILKGGQFQTIWVLIIMSGILLGGFFIWQYNILGSCHTERPFVLRMKGEIESFLPERLAFWHKINEKVLFYLKWDPPVTILADESALRTFLENDQPGVIISQGRYITETIASMLPSQPTYKETCYLWESPNKHQKKYKAWLINHDISQIALECKEENRAN
jgi:hypothetical protein